MQRQPGLSPRGNTLYEMWEDFSIEHKQEIKDMCLVVNPWHCINYWSAKYADYILDKSRESIDFATKVHEKAP